MGGRPQKPKIQGYINKQYFEEFEKYQQQHNLNQSQCLEKILSLFFNSELPTHTEIAPELTAPLEEIHQKIENLSQRLLAVESRLAVESATESAVALDRLVAESANESAIGLNGLATDSATKSAVVLHRLACESANKSANELATGSDGLANESVLPLSESVVAPNRLAPESAYESVSVAEVIAPGSTVDEAIAKSHPTPTKGGKRPPEEIKKLIESQLAHGEIIDIKKLAGIANVSPEAVRQRTENEKLGEWGVEAIPGTRPQKYRRL